MYTNNKLTIVSLQGFYLTVFYKKKHETFS